jgi:hypothetical protein
MRFSEERSRIFFVRSIFYHLLAQGILDQKLHNASAHVPRGAQQDRRVWICHHRSLAGVVSYYRQTLAPNGACSLRMQGDHSPSGRRYDPSAFDAFLRVGQFFGKLKSTTSSRAASAPLPGRCFPPAASRERRARQHQPRPAALAVSVTEGTQILADSERQSLGRLDADSVVHRIPQPLLTSQILLSRLDGDVTQ